MATNTDIPQGYKATALGIIPQEWEMKTLGQIANVFSGTTPSRENELFFNDGTIPWVKTTDLNNGILTHTEERITDIALKSTTLKVFSKGTVLIAMYGGFNQIGRTSILGIDATINQALSALILNTKEITEYFLYIGYYIESINGSGMPQAAEKTLILQKQMLQDSRF